MEVFKTKKIYLWLMVPALCLTLLALGLIFGPTQPTVTAQEVASAPKVLGAFTETRGEAPTLQPFVELKKIQEPNITNVGAKSFLIYDQASGQILAERKPDLQLSIASLTKLLTALLAYENLDLTSFETITTADQFNIKPILNLKVNDKIKLQNLFDAMLVGSNNDAAKALANFTEKSTGINFVSLMNQKAEQLGMQNSKFSNPLGFDNVNNFSTAQDLKLLVDITQKLPVFENLGKLTSYNFQSQEGNEYATLATNKLVAKHAEIEAIKTGFTENSLGSIITKINIHNHSVVFIVLSSWDREGDTLKLENQILNSFE